MKTLFFGLTVCSSLLVGGATAFAQQTAPKVKKAITLEGTILCAKCELSEMKKCRTAIRVKERGEEVVYFLADKGVKEEYHHAVCGGGTKEGKVIGRVAEKDGRKWIFPSKVEYAKE